MTANKQRWKLIGRAGNFICLGLLLALVGAALVYSNHESIPVRLVGYWAAISGGVILVRSVFSAVGLLRMKVIED